LIVTVSFAYFMASRISRERMIGSISAYRPARHHIYFSAEMARPKFRPAGRGPSPEAISGGVSSDFSR
jgi:hypothetical protein